MKSITATTKTKASSAFVWKKWNDAKPWNNWNQEASLSQGQKGHVYSKDKKVLPYKVLEVKENESFTIAWKALFIRLIFKYSVKPLKDGSQITYSVNLKGFFAFPVYYLIRTKIKKNLIDGINSFINQIET
jgi:hypothetical protein